MAKKAAKNDIPILKEQIKENRLKNLYLFYGEEEYLKEHYINKITELIPDAGLPEINRIVINGQADYSDYDDAWEGMPMMTDRRLLVIRDSNIFTIKKSKDITPPTEEQRKFWTEKFKRISDDTVIIFCEKNVDARGALYKSAAKLGFAVEFKYLSVADLKSWVIKKTLKAGKKIDDNTAEYLISVIDKGLNNLERELDKLLNYSDDVIYKTDVDRVASKSTEIVIFEITDGINAGDADKVFKILNDLRTQNVSAFGTLYLIYANVSKMLQLKLAGAANAAEAAKALGTTSWLAGNYLRGASGFSTEALTHMVKRVPEIDYEIKQGKIGEREALEQYIFEALEFKKNYH